MHRTSFFLVGRDRSIFPPAAMMRLQMISYEGWAPRLTWNVTFYNIVVWLAKYQMYLENFSMSGAFDAVLEVEPVFALVFRIANKEFEFI